MSINLSRIEKESPVSALTTTKLNEIYESVGVNVEKAFNEYLEKNGIEPVKEERESLKQEWLKKTDKSTYKRFIELADEVNKREIEKDKFIEKVSASAIDLEDISSRFNSNRHTSAEKEYDDASNSVEESIQTIAKYEAELVLANEEGDEKHAAELQNSIDEATSDLAFTEARIKVLEKTMSQHNIAIDNHQSVVSSIQMESLDLATEIDSSIKAYDAAKTEFDPGAVNADFCRQIVLGQESSDVDILEAIHNAALEGKYSFTFEADLWTWNTRTLRTLAEAGFVLDLKTSTQKYGKDGKPAGTQDVPGVGALRRTFANTDLKVSWDIDAPRSGEKM